MSNNPNICSLLTCLTDDTLYMSNLDTYNPSISYEIDFNFPATIKNIFSCSHSSFVLLENDDLYAWGSSNYIPTKQHLSGTYYKPIKLKLNLNSPIKNIISSYNGHYLMLLENGDLYVWGLNDSGQLGLGNTTYSISYQKHPTLTNISNIFVGESCSFVEQNSDKRILGFGSRSNGVLGMSGTTSLSTPTLIDAVITNVEHISSNSYGTFYLLRNGNLYMSGIGHMMGMGNTTTYTVPTLHTFSFPTTIKKAVLAYQTGYIILIDGSVYITRANQNENLPYKATYTNENDEIVDVTDVVDVLMGRNSNPTVFIRKNNSKNIIPIRPIIPLEDNIIQENSVYLTNQSYSSLYDNFINMWTYMLVEDILNFHKTYECPIIIDHLSEKITTSIQTICENCPYDTCIYYPKNKNVQEDFRTNSINCCKNCSVCLIKNTCAINNYPFKQYNSKKLYFLIGYYRMFIYSLVNKQKIYTEDLLEDKNMTVYVNNTNYFKLLNFERNNVEQIFATETGIYVFNTFDKDSYIYGNFSSIVIPYINEI